MDKKANNRLQGANKPRRQLDFSLTLAVTAHRVSRCFAKRFHKGDIDLGMTCENVDMTEHISFDCIRWVQYTVNNYGKLGEIPTPDTIIPSAHFLNCRNNLFYFIHELTQDDKYRDIFLLNVHIVFYSGPH